MHTACGALFLLRAKQPVPEAVTPRTLVDCLGLPFPSFLEMKRPQVPENLEPGDRNEAAGG